MTAVVNRAETAGKQVHPLIIRTNNPLYAVVHTAMDINAQELVLGASNAYMADEQIEQIAFYWINMHGGDPTPLTVPHTQPQPRSVLRSGRRQPDSQDRRTKGAFGGRVAGGRRGRQPRAFGCITAPRPAAICSPPP